MTARNEITGDLIQTKASNRAYRENKFWDKPEVPKGRRALDNEIQKLTDYLTTCTQRKP